ncbi:MAG: 4Fe-4S dicluster domain-containing protein [Desulfobacterales bacterium]|nr:4Fe-4S dicluster domain-containing protein [Desulfobacterales bacterium]
MAFDIFLNSSLIILTIGLLFKIAQWFSFKIGIRAENAGLMQRAFSAFKGVLKTIITPKIFILIYVFIIDVLFQYKILKQDFLRWFMHMLIFWGFMLLLFMHALETLISDPFFPNYYSTVNPYMFLRDFFGAMVLVGLSIAIFRRFFMRIPRLKTNKSDLYAIGIVAVIIFSGFLLEGSKIISYSEFRNMEEEYSALDDKDDIFALESYWVKYYSLVSPNDTSEVPEDIMEVGEEIHNDSCVDCHSRPQAAFGGYAVAKVFSPVGNILECISAVNIFYYIHILSCFLGLALLPFTKMLHIVSTPISLITSAIMQRDKACPENIATRQAIELDACVHCSTCSTNCSVAPAFDTLDNANILPSERMMSLRKWVINKTVDSKDFAAIQEGIYLCSSCERCTVVCPAGINLRELWYDVREEFIRNGSIVTPLVLTPYSYNRTYSQDEFQTSLLDSPAREVKAVIAKKYNKVKHSDDVLSLTSADNNENNDISLVDNTFSSCFSCENCTNVCPVVMNYENPEDYVDLLPHQIMRSLGLGLKDLALGSEMLWDCLTCYQCQEHCPQNVKVTDIFFELKNQISKDCFNNNDKEP